MRKMLVFAIIGTLLIQRVLPGVVTPEKQPASIGTQESYLVLQNFALSDVITTVVTDVDDYDWDNNSGPQHNFEDIQIGSGQLVQEREQVNYYATNCPFTLLLVFSDGTRDKFRINQKYALGEAQAAFEHLEGQRDIKYLRLGSNTLLINVKDNSTICVDL